MMEVGAIFLSQTLQFDQCRVLKQPGFETPKHRFPGCLMEGSGLPLQAPGATGFPNRKPRGLCLDGLGWLRIQNVEHPVYHS